MPREVQRHIWALRLDGTKDSVGSLFVALWPLSSRCPGSLLLSIVAVFEMIQNTYMSEASLETFRVTPRVSLLLTLYNQVLEIWRKRGLDSVKQSMCEDTVISFTVLCQPTEHRL